MIKVETLAESGRAWDGSAMPHYPEGNPVVTIRRYTFPPRCRTDVHLHEVINCGYVVSGELTVVNEDGAEHTFRAGEPIIETVGTPHHGENRGQEPVVLVMFYAGNGNVPLSVPVD